MREFKIPVPTQFKTIKQLIRIEKRFTFKEATYFSYQLRTPNLSKIILQVQIIQGQIFLNWAALNFPKKKLHLALSNFC